MKLGCSSTNAENAATLQQQMGLLGNSIPIQSDSLEGLTGYQLSNMSMF